MEKKNFSFTLCSSGVFFYVITISHFVLYEAGAWNKWVNHQIFQTINRTIDPKTIWWYWFRCFDINVCVFALSFYRSMCLCLCVNVFLLSLFVSLRLVCVRLSLFVFEYMFFCISLCIIMYFVWVVWFSRLVFELLLFCSKLNACRVYKIPYVHTQMKRLSCVCACICVCIWELNVK